jgi:hypothetical protein
MGYLHCTLDGIVLFREAIGQMVALSLVVAGPHAVIVWTSGEIPNDRQR